MSRDPVLELEGVDSGYGDMQVLDDLSMALYAGDIVCLIGSNGAGKRGDRPLGVGYVPQTENVFGSLSVEENLRMGGVARDDDLGAVLEGLYDRFPLLEEKRRAKARTLSGGQRQILALARALVMEPDVLLVDEPSAGLTPNTDDVFEHVLTVNEMDTAIVMVEQNAKKGLAISDRGYVLDQGTVHFEDEADALLAYDQVAELYLGG